MLPDTADARFDEMVVPEIEVLYRVAMSLTRNPADAEDLVQDTLLRAYRGIGTFDGRHPRAWLLTILRNAQINRTRRRRPELLRDPDAAGDPIDTAIPVDELVIDSGFDTHVETAFAALSDDFRRVVELVDIQGLPYRDAAGRLGVPVGTVMSRLHRARSRIRESLAASGFGVEEGAP